MTKLIGDLIEAYSGAKGRDTIGVPLINSSRMADIWQAQRKHIPCIQDPPGVTMYTKTGTTKKGGVELSNYRCGRGSTSLESFHLHLNRFIPGTLARDVLFQAYLVDGLYRWNQDRERAAMSTASVQHSYSGMMQHTANTLGLEVMGKKVVDTYTEPRKYTGELIGIEYLYSQTGKVQEDYMKAIESLETTEDESTIEDEVEAIPDTDQIDDLTVSTAGLRESADLVLEVPVLPLQHQDEYPHSSSTRKEPKKPKLRIPTKQEYEEMMLDTLNRPTSEQPSAPVETPMLIAKTSGQSRAESAGQPRAESAGQPRAESPVQPRAETSAQPRAETSGECAGEEINREPAAAEEVHIEPDDDDESVGPDKIPGYGRVQELALYLVAIWDSTYLRNAEADHVIKLWNDLSDYDKGTTIFDERFSNKDRGRYKPKKSVRNVVPGVRSTERIMRGGPGAVPATFPTANRYTEAIIIRLLAVLPRTKNRLDDVTRAYYDIRRLIMTNGRVVSQTNIQLPEISKGTLSQWHSVDGKGLDKLVLTQGVRFVQPPKTTSEGIPPPLEKPPQLTTGSAEPHAFTCPTNTAGTARMKGQKRKPAQRTTVTSQSTAAQPPASANATAPVRPPKRRRKLTSTLTVPQSTHLTAPVTDPHLTSPTAATLAVHPTSTPQSTCSPVVMQSTCPVVATLPSAAVSQLQPSCQLPAQQSTPAGLTQQSAIPVRTRPIPPLQLYTFGADGQLYPLAMDSQASSVETSEVPLSTQKYQQRKLELEKQGIFKRDYERKKIPTCKKCGQDRVKPTHIMYFMNWYCKNTATIPLETWREEMAKKEYKKGKPKD